MWVLMLYYSGERLRLKRYDDLMMDRNEYKKVGGRGDRGKGDKERQIEMNEIINEAHLKNKKKNKKK